MHPGTQESPEHGDPVKYTALGNVVGELPSLGHDYLPAASTHVNKWCLPLQFLPIEFESQGTKSIQIGITDIQRTGKKHEKGAILGPGPTHREFTVTWLPRLPADQGGQLQFRQERPQGVPAASETWFRC